MELTAHYNPWLVLTSLIVAIVASYAALDLAGRVTAARGRARLAWLLGGSMAMGIGIWSMHFVAMLAFSLPVAVRYSVPEVVVSAACAIAASLLALGTVSRTRVTTRHLLVAGLLMGPAIAGMHYIGMAALRLPADLSYNRVLWTLSVVIAIVVSWVALWLALRFRGGGRWLWRTAAAVVMGFAVVGMHYTGMAAAHFTDNPSVAVTGGLATGGLAGAVISGTVLILALTLIGGLIDRRIQTSFVEPLREIEGRFRQLAGVAEATSDFVVTADATGRLLYVNRAGRAMVGIGADEDITRMLLHDLYPVQQRQRLLDEQQPGAIRDGVWRGETSFLHRDGREIPVSLVAMAHRGSDGAVEFLSGVARDVSEQVAARQALETARETAERTAAAKSAFLANMSHEIRTPMNGILGMVELLQDTQLAPEQRRSVDVIASSGEALLTVINDVLDLSKIEAGSVEIERIPFELVSLVDATVRVLAARAHERKVELVYDVRPDVPHRVMGDPGRLRQVLTNLIGNAIKFTHEGEVVVSVSLAHRHNGVATISFAVRDTGIGIAPEHLATIFQPFGQADASTTRKYGGTGLGLSISGRLVELMGSTIKVTSAPGSGSTFRFEVELGIETEAQLMPAEPHRMNLHGRRALVVDDHATNRRIVQEILALAGVVADTADDAGTALVALRSAAANGQPYHLLVSDVHMPGRDGFDLASDVRADSALKGIRIMLLTSGGERGDAQRSRTLGISAYFLKPVSRTDLLQAAVTVMGGPEAGEPDLKLVTRHSIQEARRGMRVLLAEDNPVNQEVAAAMLRKRGHRVDVVPDGRQAVTAAGRNTYDVILMDLQMPELGGMEATVEIRRTGARVPIVALTANVLQGEREKCLAQGMDLYVSKPFKAHELFAAVEGWGPAPGNAPEPTPATPAIDLDAFRAWLQGAGAEDRLGEFLATFRQDAAGQLDALERAAAAGYVQGVRRAAHSYRSAAAAIHAQGLAEHLSRVELAGSRSDWDVVKRALEEVRREHARVMTSLAGLAPSPQKRQ